MTLKNTWKSLWGMRVPILIIGSVLCVVSFFAHLTVGERVIIWSVTAFLAALCCVLFRHRRRLEELEQADSAPAPSNSQKPSRYSVSVRSPDRLDEAFLILKRKGFVEPRPHLLYGLVYVFDSDEQLQALKESGILFSIVLERIDCMPFNPQTVPMTFDISKRKTP